MLKDLFNLKKQFFPKDGAETAAAVSESAEEAEKKPDIPDDLWAKCNGCGRALYAKLLDSNMKVCPMCAYHFRLTPEERVGYTFDENTFTPLQYDIPEPNPLQFPGYEEKLQENQEATGHTDAVLCGVGEIKGMKTAVCIMNSFFMMGSMGYVVGESITRTVEYATAHGLPIVIFTCSGGARMQEGIVSLMQMAKISGALKKHSDAGLLYITVITNPTTGGVTASFASLGDIILAEKGALIGFAGKRVIEQTIKQKLPKDFQTAEFAMEHGFVDMICERKHLRKTLGRLLALHAPADAENTEREAAAHA